MWEVSDNLSSLLVLNSDTSKNLLLRNIRIVEYFQEKEIFGDFVCYQTPSRHIPAPKSQTNFHTQVVYFLAPEEKTKPKKKKEVQETNLLYQNFHLKAWKTTSDSCADSVNVTFLNFFNLTSKHLKSVMLYA